MTNIRFSLAASAAVLALFLATATYAEENSKNDVQTKIQYCKACHGQNGQGFPGAYPVPRLAGQTVPYLINKFGVITEHRRDNPTTKQYMEPALGSVEPALRQAVAEHFSALNPPPVGGGQKDLIAEGKKIYMDGVPKANVPSCAKCHGQEAKGSEGVPRLAGQLHRYTTKVLSNWAIINSEPGPSGASATKSPSEHSLTPPQIAAVSAYLSDLK
jgi:cytochrome c553